MLSIFGEGLVDHESVEQMKSALSLPISVKGALMPDSHVGYGLPIGGVLATRGGIVPYAVGVDIACRVRLSIFDVKSDFFFKNIEKFEKALLKRTFFGVGAKNPLNEHHPVMDDPRWDKIKFLAKLKDLAKSQLGTSGSGNHFVEFGIVKFLRPYERFNVDEEYLGLVSHSGSRGLGAKICNHYSSLAKRVTNPPKTAKNLAWLPYPGEGEEYFEAMELAGDYAKANHELIHSRITKELDLRVIFSMENHHNFAWVENVDGNECFVHRKGATPAAAGQLGYIPGTMIDPGFLVLGKGNPRSINSSAHGAGRIMSRRYAKSHLSYQEDVINLSSSSGVRVLRAGRDESPKVYKDIKKVLAAQEDCVEIIAQFEPKLVVMAGDDEEAED